MLDLRVTEKLITQMSSRDEALIVVFHLTENATKFIELLSRAFAIELIVGIPYSSDPTLAAKLSSQFKVVIPKELDEIKDLVLRQLEKSSKKILILEIGGYCCELAVTPGLLIKGIVEDTMQGHWAYSKREESLKYPVVSVARTNIKELENIAIGSALVYSLEKVLREQYDESLRGKKCLVLGYGEVGKHLVNSLKSYGSRVSVFDASCYKAVKAILSGVHVNSKADLLAQADVIVGVTGHRSITESEFRLLKHGVWLASGSSKQIEFDVTALEKLDSRAPVKLVTEYFIDDKVIRLINRGFPVNFLGCSVPAKIIDLNYSEIVLELMRVGSCKPGFHLAGGQEDELCQMWLKEYEGLNFN